MKLSSRGPHRLDRYPSAELLVESQCRTCHLATLTSGTATNGSACMSNIWSTGHLVMAGAPIALSEPDAQPDAPAPAADVTPAVAPIAAADPSPAVPPMIMVVMPAMGDQIHFGLIISLENRWIRFVEFIENSVAVRNTGNRLAGPGNGSKRDHPRNAKHSGEKQATFHRNLPDC